MVKRKGGYGAAKSRRERGRVPLEILALFLPGGGSLFRVAVFENISPDQRKRI